MIVSAFLFLLAAQQPDTVRLREIVVSATKVPLPRSATTAAITVLQGAELRQRGARTVADALRAVPGATVVQAGSIGAITSLFLRGGESDYVQVLIDGVRVNNPGGVYDFGNLTLDNVERIEIVRGPVSVLYGSDAVTGVVQIFTRRGGAPRLQARLSASAGDKVSPDADARYATTAVALEAGGRANQLSYAAAAANTASDGLYSFNNQYRNTMANLNAQYAFDEATQLDWTARFTDSEFHYPTDGTGRLVDRNQFRTTEAFTSSLGLRQRWTRLSAEARAGLHQSLERYIDTPDSRTDTLGVPESHSRGRVRRSFVEMAGHYNLGASTVLSAGAELEHQVDRNRYRSGGKFPFNSNFGRSRTNRGLYVQSIYVPGALAINAGARGDFNDRFGNFLTYRLGAAYRLNGDTRIRAAVGSAFKEPTFFENYAEGFTRGNPELEPEHTQTVEAGLERNLSSQMGLVQLTVFRQRFRDLIQYLPRESGSTLPHYENLARAKADGFELEWQRLLLGSVLLNGSYAWLSTEAQEISVQDPAFEAGQPLLRRPRHSASVSASYQYNSATFDAQLNYLGKRADLDFGEFPFTRVQLPAYTTVDAGLLWGIKGVRLSARLHNLLDERYEEVLNFPARGRTLQLSLETGR